MGLKLKLIIVVALLSLLLGAMWKVYSVGYNSGIAEERSKVEEAVREARAEEAKKVKEIIKWKEKIKVVYRDKIKTIRLAEDPTGCLDHDLRSVGLGSMLPGSGQD